jgi:hypothetical protein
VLANDLQVTVEHPLAGQRMVGVPQMTRRRSRCRPTPTLGSTTTILSSLGSASRIAAMREEE